MKMRLMKVLCMLGCIVMSDAAGSVMVFAQSEENGLGALPKNKAAPPDAAEPDEKSITPPSPRNNGQRPHIRPSAPASPHYARRADSGLNEIRRAERRAKWQQRKFERAQARQRWFAASSVNCYQADVLVLNTDNASVVVPNGAQPWAEITFTEDTHQRSLSLLSPTLSCAYDRHDPVFTSADGDIAGGFEKSSGTAQLPRAATLTCYRDGARLVRARIANVVVTWGGPTMVLSFLNDENKHEDLTFDINDIGCIFEEA